MKSLDLGRLYFAVEHLPTTPQTLRKVALSWSVETTQPFRHGRCALLRAPYTSTILVVGWWSKANYDIQDEILERVLGCRNIPLGDVVDLYSEGAQDPCCETDGDAVLTESSSP